MDEKKTKHKNNIKSDDMYGIDVERAMVIPNVLHWDFPAHSLLLSVRYYCQWRHHYITTGYSALKKKNEGGIQDYKQSVFAEN